MFHIPFFSAFSLKFHSLTSSARIDDEVTGVVKEDVVGDDVRCRVKHVKRVVIFSTDINISVNKRRTLLNKVRRQEIQRRFKIVKID